MITSPIGDLEFQASRMITGMIIGWVQGRPDVAAHAPSR